MIRNRVAPPRVFAGAPKDLRRPPLRKLIIALTAIAAAAPVAAQPYSDPRDEDLVRRLPPPAPIERMGAGIGRASDALRHSRAGPLPAALDPYHRRYPYGPREPLGDLAGRRDPYARERMRG